MFSIQSLEFQLKWPYNDNCLMAQYHRYWWSVQIFSYHQVLSCRIIKDFKVYVHRNVSGFCQNLFEATINLSTLISSLTQTEVETPLHRLFHLFHFCYKYSRLCFRRKFCWCSKCGIFVWWQKTWVFVRFTSKEILNLNVFRIVFY